MSEQYDDGHGPATCNYNECQSESDVPCPFLRDSPPSQIANQPDEPCTDGYHDWRFADWVKGRMLFYCTGCLTLREKDY